MVDKSALRDEWERLERLEDTTPVRRGFDLERLLFRLAAAEGLDCRPPFRARGEQIDGLIVLDHRYLLVEAKWVQGELPASAIYAFRAKVEGKLAGTLGVFFAVNGFSDDVPDALRFGKELNVILCAGDDIRLALDDAHSLSAVLRAKLTRAAQYGEVLYRFQRHLDEVAAATAGGASESH